jgi:hypothetical protein
MPQIWRWVWVVGRLRSGIYWFITKRIVSINHSLTSRVIRFQQTTTCTHRTSLLITYWYHFCSLSLKRNYEIDWNVSGKKKNSSTSFQLLSYAFHPNIYYIALYTCTPTIEKLLSGQGFVFLSLSLEFIKRILFKEISHKICSVVPNSECSLLWSPIWSTKFLFIHI